MAKKPRHFNWSPEQMARVNARREARGKDLYIDKRMDSDDYMDRYEPEKERYGKKENQRKPSFSTYRPSALDQYKSQKGLGERMAERRSDFKSKFKPSGSMAIEKNVASEATKLNKRGKGISTPSLQGSFNRFTA
jgi:hypothetical protein